MRLTAVVLLAAACGPGTAPVVMRDEQLGQTAGPIVRPPGEVTCAAGADPLMAAFGGEAGVWGGELRDFLRDRCLSDGWSAAARACVYDAAYPDCLARTLTGWQRDRLIGFVASHVKFDLARTPHYETMVCRDGCAQPAPATPCEHAAHGIANDVAAHVGKPSTPPMAWAGLIGLVLDRCRFHEWPAEAARCYGDRGIAKACTEQLTDEQQGELIGLVGIYSQDLD